MLVVNKPRLPREKGTCVRRRCEQSKFGGIGHVKMLWKNITMQKFWANSARFKILHNNLQISLKSGVFWQHIGTRVLVVLDGSVSKVPAHTRAQKPSLCQSQGLKKACLRHIPEKDALRVHCCLLLVDSRPCIRLVEKHSKNADHERVYLCGYY